MNKILLLILNLTIICSCEGQELKKDGAIKIISKYYQLPFQTKIAIDAEYEDYGWPPEKYQQLLNEGLIMLFEQQGSIFHKRYQAIATEKARQYWIQNGSMETIDGKVSLIIFKGYKIDIQSISISSLARENKAEAEVVLTISDVSPFQIIFSPLKQAEIRKTLNFKLFDDGWKIVEDENSMNLFKTIIAPLHWAAGGQIIFDNSPLNIATPQPTEGMRNEEIALNKYINDNKITTIPTPSGIYIIQTAPGQGIKIENGSMVKLQFVVSTVDGKQIWSSKVRSEPPVFQYGQKFDTPGLDEAVGSMKKGSKAKVIVPSKMGWGEKGRADVPPNATLIYDIEIVDVQSKLDYEKEQAVINAKSAEMKKNAKEDESMLRQKYLKENNITVPPAGDGIYYIEKAKGTGIQATPGKKVKIHYTGSLLDGKKFVSSRDRNEPFEFILGKGQVIKGWEVGIAMMRKGGKAILIIPSTLAYGSRDMGVIPPYSTLVFDVELLDVLDVEP